MKSSGYGRLPLIAKTACTKRCLSIKLRRPGSAGSTESDANDQRAPNHFCSASEAECISAAGGIRAPTSPIERRSRGGGLIIAEETSRLCGPQSLIECGVSKLFHDQPVGSKIRPELDPVAAVSIGCRDLDFNLHVSFAPVELQAFLARIVRRPTTGSE